MTNLAIAQSTNKLPIVGTIVLRLRLSLQLLEKRSIDAHGISHAFCLIFMILCAMVHGGRNLALETDWLPSEFF